MKLTANAERALAEITTKHIALREAKVRFEAELKRELEERLEPYVKDRNAAVRLADDAGAPRTHIGKALGTSNYKTVQDILDLTPTSSRTVETVVAKNQTLTSGWSVVETSEGWRLTITSLGIGNVSGSAIVALVDDDLIWVDGDEFVIGQIYRNGLADEVKQALS